MEVGRRSFSLTSSWAKEQVVLVRAIDAIRLCRDGTYQAVPPSDAAWKLECMTPSDPWQLRAFAEELHLTGLALSSFDDDDLTALFKSLIQSGDLVAVKPGRPVERSGAAKRTQELRRIAHDIQNKTRGRLSHSGRQYQLMDEADLLRWSDRQDYEVVQQSEARKVLDALANQTSTADLYRTLGMSHGCVPIAWKHLKALIAEGYLKPGVLVLIHRYEQAGPEAVSLAP